MAQMISRTWRLAMVLLCLYVFLPTVRADTVHLKNGKALEVEKFWHKDDQVWFVFHGMKASIPESKVARIEKEAGKPAKPAGAKNPNPAAKPATRPQPARKTPPAPVIKPAGTRDASQPQPRSTGKPLVLGKDGLADMKWGFSRAAVRGLKTKQTDSGFKDVIEYVRPSDLLKLDGATLKTVVYAFWRDQLYTVSIWTQGREDFNSLRDSAFEHFGKGTRIDGSAEKYLWSSQNSDVMLKYSRDDQYGLLWMRSKELDRKLKLSQLTGHTSLVKQMKSIR